MTDTDADAEWIASLGNRLRNYVQSRIFKIEPREAENLMLDASTALIAAANEIARLRAEREWRPIDTYDPKTCGTKVMVWLPHSGPWITTWAEKHGFAAYERPTHYMPLPPPPAPEGEAET